MRKVQEFIKRAINVGQQWAKIEDERHDIVSLLDDVDHGEAVHDMPGGALKPKA